jgi:hypothetical protein
MTQEVPSYAIPVQGKHEKKREVPSLRKTRDEYICRVKEKLRKDPLFEKATSLQAKQRKALREKIIIDNKMRMGRPVLKGTRCTVSDILCAHADGQKHKYLQEDNLLACFVTYRENPEILK